MDFSFTDEQKQLADAVRRFIDKDYGFEARNKVVYSPAGVSQAHWDALAELGLTALPVPQAQGGFDGSAMDLLVVMQELGRGLVVEPMRPPCWACRHSSWRAARRRCWSRWRAAR